MEARDEVPSVQTINRSVDSLADIGFVPPTWEELAREAVHPPTAEDGEPNQSRVGWQATAGRAVESSFLENFRPTLSDAEGALLRSQGGPLASAPFVSFPTDRVPRLEPQTLRVLAPPPFASPSRASQLAFADMAVLSTSLAITGRRVLSWGRWDAEDSLWKTKPQESAARLVGGSEPVSSSETWTSASLTSLTQGGSRLSDSIESSFRSVGGFKSSETHGIHQASPDVPRP